MLTLCDYAVGDIAHRPVLTCVDNLYLNCFVSVMVAATSIFPAAKVRRPMLSRASLRYAREIFIIFLSALLSPK